MRDPLPPIHIRVRRPLREFLERTACIAEKSNAFRVKRHFDFLGEIGSDIVDFIPTKNLSAHQGIFGQLIARPNEKDIVFVEIRAERWGSGDSPPYEMYCAEARALIVPLISKYNRETHAGLRVVIRAKQRLEPKLPPQSEHLFARFTALANKTALHPLDWRRFYAFIRNSRMRKTISNEDMARLLTGKGFSEKDALHVAEIYGHLNKFKHLA